MDNIIIQMEARKALLDKESSALNAAIKAYQQNCDHSWEHWGNDSHYDYEKCTKCGESRKV